MTKGCIKANWTGFVLRNCTELGKSTEVVAGWGCSGLASASAALMWLVPREAGELGLRFLPPCPGTSQLSHQHSSRPSGSGMPDRPLQTSCRYSQISRAANACKQGLLWPGALPSHALKTPRILESNKMLTGWCSLRGMRTQFVRC